MRSSMGALAVAAVLLAACPAGDAPEATTPAVSVAVEATPPPEAVTPTPAQTQTPQPATPPPAATPSPTPTGPLEIAWTEQPWTGRVHAAFADDTQFVAGGSDVSGLAAWTSADAAAWTRHSVPNPTFEYDAGFPGMGPMARFADTLFSIGTFIGPADARFPVGWRSADGATWEFIESENPFYRDGYIVFDLVSGDRGLLAVNHGYAQFQGGTWRWTAETSWVETTPRSGSYRTSGIDIFDVVWAGGRFVAVGHDSTGMARSWVSTDGAAWQESPDADVLTSGVMRGVAALPAGGYVAVGSRSGTGTAAHAWTSADGLTWAAVELPGAAGAEPHAVVALEAQGGGVLALASAGTATLTWTSRDGVSWLTGATLDGVVDPYIGASGGDTLATRDELVILFVLRGADLATAPTILFRGTVQP